MVQIKRCRREGAKVKKPTMEIRQVLGMNQRGACGRRALAEFTDNDEIGADFKAKVGDRCDA